MTKSIDITFKSDIINLTTKQKAVATLPKQTTAPIKRKVGFIMCYIFTGNKFNQILIFESVDDAKKWAKSATSWNDEEIQNNIKIPKTLFGNIKTISE